MITWDELPAEIQKKMYERQIEQGNKNYGSVFRKQLEAGELLGGFDWCKTNEGGDFWYEVLTKGNIDHFYTVYPKETRMKEALKELQETLENWAAGQQKKAFEPGGIVSKPSITDLYDECKSQAPKDLNSCINTSSAKSQGLENSLYENIKASDIIRPPHYNPDSLHEPIKVIEAWDLSFNLGNVVKYISRAGKKAGAREIDDLRKALYYLEREIINIS